MLAWKCPIPHKIWMFLVINLSLNAYSKQKMHQILVFDAETPIPAVLNFYQEGN